MFERGRLRLRRRCTTYMQLLNDTDDGMVSQVILCQTNELIVTPLLSHADDLLSHPYDLLTVYQGKVANSYGRLIRFT